MTLYGVHTGLQSDVDGRPAASSGATSSRGVSTGSRSGTTSTAPPVGPTTPTASRRSPCTPRWRCRHRTGPLRIARLLDRIPAPGGDRQGDHRHRPPLRRTCRRRSRSGMGGGRVPAPTASTSPPSAPAWISWRRAPRSCAACSTTTSPAFDGDHFSVHDARNEPRPGAGRGSRSGSVVEARSGRCGSPPSSPTDGTSPSSSPETYRRQACRPAPPLRRRRSRSRPDPLRDQCRPGMDATRA